jgi:hypothetical protein
LKRPVDRIIAKLGLPGLLDALGTRLSGTDLTSLLLEVMHRRAAAVRPAHLNQRYATDRFVAPPTATFESLRRVEDALLDACVDRFEMLALAPLVPLGTHSALATVAQNKIVSTLRNNEVAADPTNALALAAAARRRAALAMDPKSPEPVSVGAIQRVVRAQHVAGAGRFAHFALFGLLSAGRDGGALTFERGAAPAHLDVHVRGLLALGATQVVVSLTDFSGGAYDAVAHACRAALSGQPAVTCVDDPTRASGNGYYSGFCFKIHARFGGEAMETSDGGIVDWTRRLVGSAKERCFISGLGIDRVALAAPRRVRRAHVSSNPEESS